MAEPLPDNKEINNPEQTEQLPEPPLEVPAKVEVRKKEGVVFSIRLEQFRKSVADFFSVFIRLATIIIILVFVFIVIKEFSNDDLVIQPFQVPAAIEEKGFNGSVLADHILNRIAEVKRSARTQKEAQQFINSSHHKDVNIEVMGLGVSIQSVVSFIKERLHLKVRTISGDLIIGDDLTLTIQMTGQDPILIHEPFADAGVLPIQNLIDHAGDQILKRSDPVILALYDIQRNNFEAAIDASAYAMDKFPMDKKWALTTYGVALRSLGKGEQGNKKIQEALKLDPKFVVGIVALAYDYANEGDYARALSACRKAIELDPTFYAPYVVMSEVYLRTNKLDSSLIVSEKALGLNPKDDKLASQFATALFYARDFDRIVTITSNWIDKDPYSKTSAFFYEAASFAELQKGNNKAALENALMANRLAADRFRGHECLASTYAFMGRFDDARKEADWSYQKNNSYWGFYKIMAEVYAFMKMKEEFYANLGMAVDRGYLLFLAAENKPFIEFAGEERFKRLVEQSKNNRVVRIGFSF